MKVAFHTLGCKVNAYETQAILEQFQENGFTIVDFQDAADVYIVNTCSVTAEAARKSRQMLHRCKKRSADAIVVATGCYAQEVKEELLRDQTIDMIVGNNEKNKLLEAVCSLLQQRKKDPEKRGFLRFSQSPINRRISSYTAGSCVVIRPIGLSAK